MQENMKYHFNDRYLFLLLIIVLSLLGLTLVAVSWIGFRNYPDGIFAIRAALLWLNEFPYLGTTHWELRHPHVLSMALSILISGTNELSVLAPNIAAYLMILIITLSIFHKNGYTALGIMASIFLLSVPLFCFSATTVFPDVFELLLVLSSIVLFYSSISREKPGWIAFFLAGLLGGFAFTTRETSIALAVCYFVLFVCRFGGKRSVYFIVAVGFVLPVIADYTYVYIQSGDPFYKLKVDTQQYHPGSMETRSVDFIEPVLFEQLDAVEDIEKRVTRFKQYKVGRNKPIYQHLKSFLTNHEYQAIFLITIPAIIYLFFSPPEGRWLRRLLLIFYVLAISWFITVVYFIDLDSLPRYLLPVTYTAVILTATATYNLFRSKRYFIACLVIIFLSGVSVLSYDLQSEMLREERLLVEIAETHNELVYTSPYMVKNAKFFIQTRALIHLIDDAPPPSGALFLYSNGKKYLKGVPDHILSLYDPEKSWEVLEKHVPRTRFLGLILTKLVLLEAIPKHIREKIYKPGSIVTLYRVG
jgi:hypothetical protein